MLSDFVVNKYLRLLHLVGCLLTLNYDAWNHELKICYYNITTYCRNTTKIKHIAIESVKFSYSSFLFVYYYIQILNISTLST